MCYDTDSRPPIEPKPIEGGAVDASSIVLTSADGATFAAYQARAATPSGAAMLIEPDVRGLRHYFEELALRFAEAGIDAIAIDHFGRTAGPSRRDEEFEHGPHVGQTTWAGLRADAGAAVGALRGDGRDVRAVFSVGFCFGGRVSFLLGTRPELELSGVIGFYGFPAGPFRNDTPAPADLADQFVAPVLGLFGGADQGIDASAVARFEGALSAAGIDHELITYPGAPHGFFDRKQGDFATESADAWDRVLRFVRDHTPAAM